MKHIISNNDCFNIVQIPKKDGTFVKKIEMSFVFLQKHKKILYDDSGLINKMYFKIYEKKVNTDRSLFSPGKRIFYYAIINNKIKYIEVGKTLSEIIDKDCTFSYSANDCLYVKCYNVFGANAYEYLPNYSKSYVIKKEDLFNSEKDYFDFIIKNQSYYLEDILSKDKVINNIDIIKKDFGDIYSEVIKEDRDKKIDKIFE